jgi:hypothetical protein
MSHYSSPRPLPHMSIHVRSAPATCFTSIRCTIYENEQGVRYGGLWYYETEGEVNAKASTWGPSRRAEVFHRNVRSISIESSTRERRCIPASRQHLKKEVNRITGESLIDWLVFEHTDTTHGTLLSPVSALWRCNNISLSSTLTWHP